MPLSDANISVVTLSICRILLVHYTKADGIHVINTDLIAALSVDPLVC